MEEDYSANLSFFLSISWRIRDHISNLFSLLELTMYNLLSMEEIKMGASLLAALFALINLTLLIRMVLTPLQ